MNSKTKGYIYAITQKENNKKTVKIGMTSHTGSYKDVKAHLTNRYSTYYISPKIEFLEKTNNPRFTEQSIINQLTLKGLHVKKEHFVFNKVEIRKIFNVVKYNFSNHKRNVISKYNLRSFFNKSLS